MPFVEVDKLAAAPCDKYVANALVLLYFFILAEVFDCVEEFLYDGCSTGEVEGDLVPQRNAFEVSLDFFWLLRHSKARKLNLLLRVLANVIDLHLMKAEVETLNNVQVAVIAVLG